MTITPDQFQFYRTIKGAPALVLWIILTQQRTLTVKEIEHYSGYKRESVLDAVRILGPDGMGIAAVSIREHGAQVVSLAQGWQLRLPGLTGVDLIDSCFPTTTTLNLLHPKEIEVVTAQKQKSIKSTSENPHHDECLKACKQCGIGEPSASTISGMQSDSGDWMTPALILAHAKALARPRETIGLAITRLKGWEPLPERVEPERKLTTHEMVQDFLENGPRKRG